MNRPPVISDNDADYVTEHRAANGRNLCAEPAQFGRCPSPVSELLFLEREKEISVAKRIEDLRRYALVGAEQRLIQIGNEARAILQAFPELRARGRGFEAKASDAQAGGTMRRRRRKMSAEARKRISEAQKFRWAKQKRGAKKSA
jgi:hypothetical protein